MLEFLDFWIFLDFLDCRLLIFYFILQNPLTSLLTKQPVGECFSFIDFKAGFNV